MGSFSSGVAPHFFPSLLPHLSLTVLFFSSVSASSYLFPLSPISPFSASSALSPSSNHKLSRPLPLTNPPQYLSPLHNSLPRPMPELQHLGIREGPLVHLWSRAGSSSSLIPLDFLGQTPELKPRSQDNFIFSLPVCLSPPRPLPPISLSSFGKEFEDSPGNLAQPPFSSTLAQFSPHPFSPQGTDETSASDTHPRTLGSLPLDLIL